jgi:muramoyltetrapeptide carboxypeptidase
MDRRKFIGSTMAAGVLAGVGSPMLQSQTEQNVITESEERAMIKPKALEKGDTIGIIAPGTAVSDPKDFLKAKEVLEHYGFKAFVPDAAGEGIGYKTQSVEAKVKNLHQLFENKQVDGIMCLRGGYGSGRILDSLDYDLIRNNPKAFVGFSDITAMHLAINKYAGLVTFHGPVLLSGFSAFTAEQFQRVLMQKKPIGKLENNTHKSGIRVINKTRMISAGKTSGNLIGGNISLITSLMGTPYEIDTKGKILIMEDVGEEPYRMDRMLNQLRLAGKFDDCAGIVVGQCSDCGFGDSRVWDMSFNEVLDDFFKDLGKPVFYGFQFGHTYDQMTVPFGVEATMDADDGTITINEAAVV